MTALDLPDVSLSGLVAYYSTIRIPWDRLPDVFAGFHRVLAPGGHAMLAFQVGDEPSHRTEDRIELDFFRRRPDDVAELLGRAALPVTAQLVREPDKDEQTPHAYLLARRSSDSRHF